MEPWQIALLTGLVSFAANFGGMVAAMKYIGRSVEEAKATGRRAHERLDAHIHDHATGAL